LGILFIAAGKAEVSSLIVESEAVDLGRCSGCPDRLGHEFGRRVGDLLGKRPCIHTRENARSQRVDLDPARRPFDGKRLVMPRRPAFAVQ
jgi:hypothetical protein